MAASLNSVSTQTTSSNNTDSSSVSNDNQSPIITITIVIVAVCFIIIIAAIIIWFLCKRRCRRKSVSSENLKGYDVQHTHITSRSDDDILQSTNINGDGFISTNLTTVAENRQADQSRNNTVVTINRLISANLSRGNVMSVDTMTMPEPNSYHGSAVTVTNGNNGYSHHNPTFAMMGRTLSDHPINESESDSSPPPPPPPTKSMMGISTPSTVPNSPGTYNTAVSSEDASVYAKQEKYLREEMAGKSNRTLISTVSGTSDATTLYKLQNRYMQEEMGVADYEQAAMLDNASMTAKHTLSKTHHLQNSDVTDLSLFHKQIQYLQEDISERTGAHTAVV